MQDKYHDNKEYVMTIGMSNYNRISFINDGEEILVERFLVYDGVWTRERIRVDHVLDCLPNEAWNELAVAAFALARMAGAPVFVDEDRGAWILKDDAAEYAHMNLRQALEDGIRRRGRLTALCGHIKVASCWA